MGAIADGGGEPRLHHDAARTSTSAPARRTATCSSASKRRRSKVIELGYADPKRIGVTGHSYGGEGAAFIGVMSKMFAAVGMGAGVTDLYSDFSQSWGWSYQVLGGSGANGNDYYLYGQGRWGFSPWDNPELYRFESALTHAPKARRAVPDHARHRRSDGRVQRRPRTSTTRCATTARRRSCWRIPAKGTACAAWRTARTSPSATSSSSITT